MAYTAQTASGFKARYPEFTDVSGTLVSLVLSEAEMETDVNWWEGDRAPAVLALTAHWLVEQNATGGPGAAGQVSEVQVGDVRTKFVGANASISSAAGLGSTRYGKRFLELRTRNTSLVYSLTRA